MGDPSLVRAVLDDFETAPVSDKTKALFRLIAKIAHDSTSIRQEDIDQAHIQGLVDEELYDAITVVSLFQFYNCWIDATGVHDMPADAYEIMGKRMAESGYARK